MKAAQWKAHYMSIIRLLLEKIIIIKCDHLEPLIKELMKQYQV